MSSLRNKVSLIGRTGSKPEVQKLSSGQVISRLSIATNEGYRNKDGEWQEKTQWHSLIIWGKAAERFVRTIGKGFEIAIEGRLVNRQYEAKTGEKRYVTEIEVSDFLLLSSKVKSE